MNPLSESASEKIKQLALFCILSPNDIAKIEVMFPNIDTLVMLSFHNLYNPSFNHIESVLYPIKIRLDNPGLKVNEATQSHK